MTGKTSPLTLKNDWLREVAYLPHVVLSIRTEQDRIRQQAEEALAVLDARLASETHRLAFLHGILTKQSHELVKDLETLFKFIGFNKVLNMDEQTAGPTLEEDLRIFNDGSPTLLVEAKGLRNLPREDDTLQVVKYIGRRKEEWGRQDVQGVCIINHQRNTPCLERHHDNAFLGPQVRDAENYNVALFTTWQLFLLVRAAEQHGWDPEVIRKLFYRKGRCAGLPAHYASAVSG